MGCVGRVAQTVRAAFAASSMASVFSESQTNSTSRDGANATGPLGKWSGLTRRSTGHLSESGERVVLVSAVA